MPRSLGVPGMTSSPVQSPPSDAARSSRCAGRRFSARRPDPSGDPRPVVGARDNPAQGTLMLVRISMTTPPRNGAITSAS